MGGGGQVPLELSVKYRKQFNSFLISYFCVHPSFSVSLLTNKTVTDMDAGESSDKCFLWAAIQRMRLVCHTRRKGKGCVQEGSHGRPKGGCVRV